MTKSHTDNRGEGASGPFGPGVLLADRDPQTVRRWIAAWSVDGDQLALAGPAWFAVDFGNALYRLRASGEVDAVFLWPSVPGTPVGVYVAARETLRRWQRNEGDLAGWSMILARADFDMPDLFALVELSERSKSRRAA